MLLNYMHLFWDSPTSMCLVYKQTQFSQPNPVHMQGTNSMYVPYKCKKSLRTMASQLHAPQSLYFGTLSSPFFDERGSGDC